MDNQKFSKKSALLFGWEVIKARFWFIMGLFWFNLIFMLAPEYISDIPDKMGITGIYVIYFFVFSIIFWIFSVIISIGFLHITYLFAKQREIVFYDLFSKSNKILNYILASFLYGIITLFGFVFLIIPGVVFMVRLQFYTYIVLEEDMGPIEALKRSWVITKGSGINLSLFWVLLILVNIIGALALVVGIVITIPLTMIATAYVYKKLAD